MESEEPFTKADVRAAQQAFRFAKKCLTAIDQIVAGVESWFKNWYRTRANFTKTHFSPTFGSVFAYTTLKWGRLRRIWISIFIEPFSGELAYSVSLWAKRSEWKKINRFLCWEEGDPELYTWRTISGYVDSKNMIPRVREDLKKLRGGLNRAC